MHDFLRYYSVDLAGNAEAARSRGYALDLADPVGALLCGNLTPLRGQRVLFDASNSSDQDSGVRAYRFVFGDGTETGWTGSPDAVHVFALAGVYTVTLTVRDGSGRESAPVTASVVVSEPPPPKRPAAPEPSVLDRLRPFLPAIILLAALGAAGAALAARQKGGREGAARRKGGPPGP